MTRRLLLLFALAGALFSLHCSATPPTRPTPNANIATTPEASKPPRARGMVEASGVLLVQATVETEPTASEEDSADDAAIWVNPADAAESTIIGTNKKGGLAVYDLTGRQLQFLADGLMNNVDLRADFPLGGERVALVTTGNRQDNSIAIYRINAATRMLENVAARRIITAGEVYGSCMYRSARTGKFYYFVNTKDGVVEQWELFDNGSGKVDARRVRNFKIATQTEGCVADDELGFFYIGEEDVGIWKYGAEPDAATTRTMIDKALDKPGAGGHLVADVEGLTIAYGENGGGYLIASSQGNNSYVLYRRGGNNEYVKTFRIVNGDRIDGTEDTDGIDVVTVSLGAAFSRGVFVAQDGDNKGGNQNFKLVPWDSIIGDL